MRIGIRDYDESVIHIDVFPMIGLSENKRTNYRILKEFLVLQWIYKIKNYNFKEIFNKKKGISIILFIIKIVSSVIPNSLIENYTVKKLFMFNSSKSLFVVNPFSKYGEKSIFNKEYEPTIYGIISYKGSIDDYELTQLIIR